VVTRYPRRCPAWARGPDARCAQARENLAALLRQQLGTYRDDADRIAGCVAGCCAPPKRHASDPPTHPTPITRALREVDAALADAQALLQAGADPSPLPLAAAATPTAVASAASAAAVAAKDEAGPSETETLRALAEWTAARVPVPAPR
jgi:hypothetical protein